MTPDQVRGLLKIQGEIIKEDLMISTIVSLVVIGLVFWCVLWFVDWVGVPEPFNKVIKVVLGLFALLYVLGVLFAIPGVSVPQLKF